MNCWSGARSVSEVEDLFHLRWKNVVLRTVIFGVLEQTLFNLFLVTERREIKEFAIDIFPNLRCLVWIRFAIIRVLISRFARSQTGRWRQYDVNHVLVKESLQNEIHSNHYDVFYRPQTCFKYKKKTWKLCKKIIFVFL